MRRGMKLGRAGIIGVGLTPFDKYDDLPVEGAKTALAHSRSGTGLAAGATRVTIPARG